jgi:putative transposase
MLWAVQISAPLYLHGLKAAQQELSKSSRLLDLPEHWLHDLLSQSVAAAITGALQLLPHFLRHLAADLTRGLGRMLGPPVAT